MSGGWVDMEAFVLAHKAARAGVCESELSRGKRKETGRLGRMTTMIRCGDGLMEGWEED